MSPEPFPDRTPIRLPRDTSLWVPLSRTVLLWLIVWIIGFIGSFELIEFFIEAIRGNEQRAPVAPPRTGFLALELGYAASFFALLVAIPIGIWDCCEVLGPSSRLQVRTARFLLFIGIFIGGAWFGRSTIETAWTDAVMTSYRSPDENADRLAYFSTSRYVAVATKQMMFYGLMALLPVAAIVTALRRRNERVDEI